MDKLIARNDREGQRRFHFDRVGATRTRRRGNDGERWGWRKEQAFRVLLGCFWPSSNFGVVLTPGEKEWREDRSEKRKGEFSPRSHLGYIEKVVEEGGGGKIGKRVEVG